MVVILITLVVGWRFLPKDETVAQTTNVGLSEQNEQGNAINSKPSSGKAANSEGNVNGLPARSAPAITLTAASGVVWEYESGKNKSAFFKKYADSADARERYFAFRAFSECSMILQPFDTVDSIASVRAQLTTAAARSKMLVPAQTDAIDLLMQTCGDFHIASDRNRSHKQGAALLRSLTSSEQTPFGMARALNDELAKDSPNQLIIGKFLVDASNAFDGYSLIDFSGTLAAIGASGNLIMGGEPVAAESIGLLQEAVALLGCDYGQTCGSNDTKALVHCAYTQECGVGLAEAMRKQIYAPAQYNRILEMREQIRIAIRAGDMTFLKLKK